MSFGDDTLNPVKSYAEDLYLFKGLAEHWLKETDKHDGLDGRDHWPIEYREGIDKMADEVLKLVERELK